MKFNFRKIASVLASAIMLGSTLGTALAATAYPAPFVAGGSADSAVVVTSGSHAGAVSDWDAAVGLQSALQGLVTTTTTTTTATAAGGDYINLATSSQKIYMDTALNAARTILTKDYLPTVLADGSAYDSSGTEYKYTQKITLPASARNVTFGKSGESMDPVLMVDIGTSTTAAANNPAFYNYTVTLQKQMNVSNAAVIGTATLKLQGVSYTVGANSDANTLYLYGSGVSATVNGGETKTVEVNDKEHTILLIGTTSTTSASLEVDGSRKTVTKGSSYKYDTGEDQIEIYIKDIFHAVREADTPSIDLLVGAKTLHFEDGQAIRYGADDTAILNTIGAVTGTGGTQLTSLSIVQSAASSTGDYVKEGGKYTDRVFGGVEVQLVGVTPTLDSAERSSVKLDTDNAVATKVTMTTDKAGVEKTVYYARDADLVKDANLNIVRLANSNNKTIHVLEGENATIGEWIVANDNDEGRILEVISLPAGTSSSDYVGLQDILTGESFKLTTGYDNASTTAAVIGGGQYYAYVVVTTMDASDANLSLTWGPGAAAGTYGTQRTLFPRIALKNGGWMTFLQKTTINNGTTYSLPGEVLWTGYRDGETFGFPVGINLAGTAPLNETTETVGSIVYNISNIKNGTTTDMFYNITGIIGNLNTPSCNFSDYTGPAVLIEEPKTTKDANGQTICIPLTRVGSSDISPGIGTPTFSDAVGTLVTLTSDSYTSQAVDLFGTLVSRNIASGTNYEVNVKMPKDQMTVDILFTGVGVTTTAGEVASGTGGTIMVVKDTEVDSVKDKNLIVIGGSCINKAAAKVLNVSEETCGADFTTKTNVDAGKYLIKVVASPYNSAKTALLVAGYEAAETKLAVAKLKESHATDVGTSEVYPKTSA